LQELAAAHPRIGVEICDVTDAAERGALVKRTLAAHGRIDVLVNDAGVGAIGYLDELEADDVEPVYGTNVVAVADLTRLVLPGMRARADGPS
jgi:NADP-dependent 3-hydroxy acid dehydrogenase YdfG